MTTRCAAMSDRRSFFRRRQPRAVVTWPVTVFCNGKTLRGRVENISRGGALLYLAEQPQPDEVVRLVIEIPDCPEVVTAEGTVVRTFRLKRGTEPQFPFAVALEFTEIAEKNLRLLTAVLPPEWQREYVEPKGPAAPSPSRTPAAIFAGLGLLVVGVMLLLYFIAAANRADRVDGARIERIAARLEQIESRLQALQAAKASITNVAGKIDTMQSELNTVKKTLPEIGKIEQLVQQLEAREGEAVAAGAGDAPQPPEALAAVDGDAEPSSEPAYHVVKKGETLYRISVNYHLKIDYLRQVNGLDAGSQIHPGQILLVK